MSVSTTDLRRLWERNRPGAPLPAALRPAGPVDRDRLIVDAILPIQVQSEANTRGHWRAKAARAKCQRTATAACLRAMMARHGGSPKPPLVVHMVRLIGPRGRKMDDDNLRGAFKAVRDGVADWLGVDDGLADLVRYTEPTQEKHGGHAVRIVIERGVWQAEAVK
jgi:hypothetical protein